MKQTKRRWRYFCPLLSDQDYVRPLTYCRYAYKAFMHAVFQISPSALHANPLCVCVCVCVCTFYSIAWVRSLIGNLEGRPRIVQSSPMLQASRKQASSADRQRRGVFSRVVRKRKSAHLPAARRQAWEATDKRAAACSSSVDFGALLDSGPPPSSFLLFLSCDPSTWT